METDINKTKKDEDRSSEMIDAKTRIRIETLLRRDSRFSQDAGQEQVELRKSIRALECSLVPDLEFSDFLDTCTSLPARILVVACVQARPIIDKTDISSCEKGGAVGMRLPGEFSVVALPGFTSIERFSQWIETLTPFPTAARSRIVSKSHSSESSTISSAYTVSECQLVSSDGMTIEIQNISELRPIPITALEFARVAVSQTQGWAVINPGTDNIRLGAWACRYLSDPLDENFIGTDKQRFDSGLGDPCSAPLNAARDRARSLTAIKKYQRAIIKQLQTTLRAEKFINSGIEEVAIKINHIGIEEPEAEVFLRIADDVDSEALVYAIQELKEKIYAEGTGKIAGVRIVPVRTSLW